MDKISHLLVLITLNSVKIIFFHFYGVCESTRDCIIERLNFVIKILYGVRILDETKFNDFHIPYRWCMICSIHLMKLPIEYRARAWPNKCNTMITRIVGVYCD